MFLETCIIFRLALITSNSKNGNYTVGIEDSTLERIWTNNSSPHQLNLSNMNISAINKEAFANFSDLETLNLANNRLKTLPKLENLSNLQILNLANNDIRSGKFYANLTRLKILDLSGNSLTDFEPGHFFGLSNSTDIFTNKLHLSSIAAAMFENPETVKRRPLLVTETKNNRNYEDDDPKPLKRPNAIEVKICIKNGNLMSVDNLESDTLLLEGCRKINLTSDTLYLDKMAIKTFEHGWFRLHDQYLTSIVLSDNEIVEFTKELLNDLPAEITKVELSRNKIKKLKKGIIDNSNKIYALDLSDNFISEIEDGAFEKLNITKWLLLDDNRLENTKFLDTLPRYIQRVSLDRNKITEISTGNFNEFTRFKGLSLSSNGIKEINADKLRGFSSLTHLSLRSNLLQNIEPSGFQHLPNLLYLDLTNNSISNPQSNMFVDLKKIKHIRLEHNGIEEILLNLLATLPDSLEVVSLGRNNIKYLIAEGSEGHSWAFWKNFKWNSSSIDQGKVFNMPNLRVLDLRDNLLTDVEGHIFERMKNLAYLSLAGNQITTIKKGFAQHLGNIYFINISRNPIKKLVNGALFGLQKESDTVIRVDGLPLQIIQGGLFNDV